ncbi:MAG: hypothetical protein ACM3X1_03150 [Ignavibacteriales bacterium]
MVRERKENLDNWRCSCWDKPLNLRKEKAIAEVKRPFEFNELKVKKLQFGLEKE